MDRFKDKLEIDEEELYREAMMNAYLILMDKLTFDDLIEYNGGALPWNPLKKVITKETIDNIISYFCELEEYEKCEDLVKVKKQIFNKNNN
tara:strand:- start:9 stop:281 length:273 start_codon:yes stop_codon:yes gene_type:complete